MKGIVLYKSKYGATKQYANWIGKELGIPVSQIDNIKPGLLDQFDYLILGSSVYIGKLLIAKWLKEKEKILEDKKLYFFVVCGTPPDKTDQLNSYLDVSVPENIRRNSDVFFLPGKMILKELSWLDRMLLKMGAKLTKDPKESKRMLTEYNGVRKENISEIMSAVANSQVQV
jgi:menaquinone-dependent protoporphyrinogen IX oxidase